MAEEANKPADANGHDKTAEQAADKAVIEAGPTIAGEEQKKKIELDFSKSYTRRRPDEPRSHYVARLKFVENVLQNEVVDDEKVEVLSHCYSNFKYMRCKYKPEIMELIEKHDPVQVKKEEPKPVEEEEDEAVAVEVPDEGKGEGDAPGWEDIEAAWEEEGKEGEFGANNSKEAADAGDAWAAQESPEESPDASKESPDESSKMEVDSSEVTDSNVKEDVKEEQTDSLDAAVKEEEIDMDDEEEEEQEEEVEVEKQAAAKKKAVMKTATKSAGAKAGAKKKAKAKAKK